MSQKNNIEIIRKRAIEVFGNKVKANRWLKRPHPIFGDVSALEIVKKEGDAGKAKVLELLAKIAWGAAA